MGALVANGATGWLTRNIGDYPDGIIIPVDKPYRWTSADVVRKLKFAAKRHFGQKNLKVGHAGTLDPLATGVLIVCIGKATKLAEEIQRSDKEYVAGITFGATTPSYDLEKDVDRYYPVDGVSEASVAAAQGTFIGEQEQVAPLFSAKSVEGVRAYELARKLYKAGSFDAIDSDATALLSRQLIRINSLELLSFAPSAVMPDPSSALRASFPTSEEKALRTMPGASARINVADTSGLGLPRAEIRISCSKGTYIRAFARDLGEALGSGAFLHSLTRTACGGFRIENALSVEAASALLAAENKESL